MDVTNKSKVVEHLVENTVDFVLVSIIPSKPQVNKLELIKNELVLVGNKSTALKARKNLDQCRYLIRELGSATRQAMEEFMLVENIEPQRIIELTTNKPSSKVLLPD